MTTHPRRRSTSRQWLIVLACALAARLAFAAVTHDTYDYDEFVILLLARDYAHGAVPYHTFMFFHPPGILILFRLLEPLTSLWWPISHFMVIGIDTGTTMLVWRIAQTLYDRRTALVAGLLYAFHPLALLTATRVGQDPIITFLGILGLLLLLRTRGFVGAMISGALLALAVWTKLPALLFLPVFALARPRMFPVVLLGFVATLCAVAVPFWPQHHALYDQIVTFQRTRWSMSLVLRLETIGLFWIVANLLAFPALMSRRVPTWLALGFLISAAFVVTSQVYYHYFLPSAPFAALLAAPVVMRLCRGEIKPLIGAGSLLAVACGVVVAVGGQRPLLITAAHLSDIEPTIRYIDRWSRPDEPILADRLEYAYLAHRLALGHYFRNVGTVWSAQDVERYVPRARLVVLSYGASSGYPPGVQEYLTRTYPRFDTKANTVWRITTARL